MDNGYSKWQEYAQKRKKTRRKASLIASLIIVLISFLIFCFGYDNDMTIQQKLTECSIACISLIVTTTIVIYCIYKVKKYVPLCNKCGKEIKNVKKDCIVDKIDFLGTVDKTVYESTNTTIKGKTTFNRDGYAMKNSTVQRTSTTTYDINQKIPVVKKFYVYNIEYKCKNCNEVFCNYQEESIKPLHAKK